MKQALRILFLNHSVTDGGPGRSLSVNSLGSESLFIFTGYKRDIKPYLKDFDIFVIPSSYPDPFPRVVIEAMSFVLLVVGSSVGGITESVEDGNRIIK